MLAGLYFGIWVLLMQVCSLGKHSLGCAQMICVVICMYARIQGKIPAAEPDRVVAANEGMPNGSLASLLWGESLREKRRPT